MQFESTVKATTWDESNKRWKVTVSHHPKDGEETEQVWLGRHLILASGCLSAPQLPKFPGLDTFQGGKYHTGLWPREGVDFTGRTVACIGTGSSAVQTIPIVAAQADKLVVFQRTPAFSVPAHNSKLTPEQVAEQKKDYQRIKDLGQIQGFGAGTFPNPTRLFKDTPPEERDKILEEGWAIGGAGIMFAWADVITNTECNDYVKEFVHKKIRSIVKDQKTADLLCPDYAVACKRVGGHRGHCAQSPAYSSRLDSFASTPGTTTPVCFFVVDDPVACLLTIPIPGARFRQPTQRPARPDQRKPDQVRRRHRKGRQDRARGWNRVRAFHGYYYCDWVGLPRC